MVRAYRAMLVVVSGCALVGCFGASMESATVRTGQNPRSDGVLDIAAQEIGCAVGELRIVAETQRRYVNETAFRFVIEGCGERLGFVEQCAIGAPSAGAAAVVVNDSLWCRYLLVSRLPLKRPQPSSPTETTPP